MPLVTCQECGKSKEGRARPGSDGVVRCRPCSHARRCQTYRKTDKGRASADKWNDTDSHRAATSKYLKTEKGKEAARRKKLKRRFGITSEQYDMMLDDQGGVCAICSKEDAAGKRLAVDHCHETGKVRGLLCLKCNTVLGKMNDEVNLLKKAIAYLEKD